MKLCYSAFLDEYLLNPHHSPSYSFPFQQCYYEYFQLILGFPNCSGLVFFILVGCSVFGLIPSDPLGRLSLSFHGLYRF